MAEYASRRDAALPPGVRSRGNVSASSSGVYDDPATPREQQLARVPFFDGLTHVALGLIANATKEESHATGTKIFQYGDPGDKLFVILEGKVRISREVAGMGEEALAVLGPGEVFGEMSLLDESPRSADARVHERCRLLVITKESFDDLLFLHKDLAYEVLWNCVRILSARLRETNEKLTFLTNSGKF
jgi:CRP/FNR family transcriptional regulator, cyclic AMP receptor protein